jgi:redox-sensitive bicupin YhaK (pirin superfamily)
MAIKRKIVEKYEARGHQGFMGPDHIARAVIQVDFEQSDPFIMLMDDFLDKKNDNPVGGAHPHAGFEIVSLLLDGKMEDIEAGGMQVLTTGSGIVHTETIHDKALLRLMQLWVNIPKDKRGLAPKLQDIKLANVPKIIKEEVSIRLYAGSLEGATSPVVTNVPLIIADIKLTPNKTTILRIPASYSTFLYNLEGEVLVGEEQTLIEQYEVGWLDRYFDQTDSEIKLTATGAGARLLLYAGKPLGENIIPHGPFIVDNQEDVAPLYRKYRNNEFPNINTFVGDSLVKYE